MKIELKYRNRFIAPKNKEMRSPQIREVRKNEGCHLGEDKVAVPRLRKILEIARIVKVEEGDKLFVGIDFASVLFFLFLAISILAFASSYTAFFSSDDTLFAYATGSNEGMT